VDWYADLDGFRVDTYNYSDPAGIAWTKAITDEYPNFNIVGEIWMQSQAKAYWQRQNWRYKKYNTYRVLWTLRYSMLLAPFSVKMMDPGTKEW
jgi:hypothetical protein